MPAGVAKALLPESDGSSPKKTQGKPVQNQTTGPNTDAQLTQPQLTTPGETGKPTTASRPGDGPQRVLLTERDTPMGSDVKPGVTPDTARGNPDMVPAKPETAPQIQPEMEKPDIAQDVSKTRTGAPRLTTDLRTEADVNTDADSAVTPVSYEDALRDYLGKGTEPVTVLNTGPDAEPSTPQEAAPKTKEQVISELAPKVQMPRMTPGRATIAAQEMYTEAGRRFGNDCDTVLQAYQPGQNPRRFLDGFQNAYILGKQGERAAVDKSGTVMYLTESQRNLAYDLGGNTVAHNAGDRKMVIDEQKSLMYNGDQNSIGEYSLRFLSTKDALYVNSENISPLMGYEDIVCHADPFTVGFVDPATGETVQEMDARVFAKVIKESGKYNGGPIRLIACEAGKYDDGFAQKLADELGVPILAPQNPVFVDSQGKMVVAKNRIQAIERFRHLFGDWSEEGWTLFKPKEY